MAEQQPLYKTDYLNQLAQEKTVVHPQPEIMKWGALPWRPRKAAIPIVKEQLTSAEGINEIWDNTKYMGVSSSFSRFQSQWVPFIYSSVQNEDFHPG